MHEHPQDDPELLSEIEKLGYDPRDVDVSKTPWHAVYLYVGCAAAIGIAWLIMWLIDKSQVTVPDEATFTREMIPEAPNPLLQSNITAHKDIEDLRAQEAAKVEKASWIDKEAGIARIPVSVAIERMLEEGFGSNSTLQQSDPAGGVLEAPAEENLDSSPQPSEIAETEEL